MNIDKCPRCGLRHSSEDCPSTMAAFHLSRMDPDYSAPAAPQAPSGQQAEPTDAEIIKIWDAWPRQGITSRARAVQFARAVLALAGQQAEPTDEQINDLLVGPNGVKGCSTLDAARMRVRSWLAGQQSERPAPAGQAVKSHHDFANKRIWCACIDCGGKWMDLAASQAERPAPAGDVLTGQNYGWIDGQYYDCLEDEYRRRLAALENTK